MRLSTGFIVCLATAGLASRAAEASGPWLQAQAGLVTQNRSPCMADVAGLGAGLGQWAAPAWGWELSLVTSRLRDKAGRWRSRETHADATCLWAPFPAAATGAWKPFLRAGAGVTHLENPVSLIGGSVSRLNLVGGAGTQLAFGPRGLASGEVRAVRVESDAARTEYQVLLGIGWHWGRAVGGF